MEPYYDHDGITIYHGDCREVLPQLEPVDLVLTDPPYGTGWVRGGKSAGVFEAVHEQPMWDIWKTDWIASLGVCKRAIFCPISKMKELDGIPLYWRKTNPRPGGPTREAIMVSPTPWAMLNWELSCYNGDASLHPCEKPMPVMRWLVVGLSHPGHIILDPFMGSGTTLRAAKDLGRRAIGIEIEEKDCEIAAKRLAQEVLKFG
jgi:site-specific DNA-methyltransferase (adenine-specific)